MRAKKWLVIVTFGLSVVSLILFIFSRKGNVDDIALAIFGGALLGCIMSLVEYFAERRNAMQAFWLESLDVLKKLRKIKPIDINVPYDIILPYIEEDINNKQCDMHEENISNALGLKITHEKRDGYIRWLLENNNFPFLKNSNKDEILVNMAEEDVSRAIGCFEEVIMCYSQIATLSLQKLDSAYGALEFIFSNRFIRQRAYDRIYYKFREIINQIKKEVFHFNLWDKGGGNFNFCIKKAVELDSLFFQKVNNSCGVNSYCIYQKLFDDIDEELEYFRTKIYLRAKKQEINRLPVVSGITSLDEIENKEKRIEMKESIKNNIVFCCMSIAIFIIYFLLYGFILSKSKYASSFAIIAYCILFVSIIATIYSIISMIHKIKYNNTIKHLPYNYNYIMEYKIYMAIGKTKRSRFVKNLDKIGITIPDKYSMWKKDILFRYSSLINDEDFYHYLIYKQRWSKIQYDMIITVLTPVEIGIMTLILSDMGDKEGGGFIILGVATILVIFLTIESYRGKTESAYVSDIIDILCYDVKDSKQSK